MLQKIDEYIKREFLTYQYLRKMGEKPLGSIPEKDLKILVKIAETDRDSSLRAKSVDILGMNKYGYGTLLKLSMNDESFWVRSKAGNWLMGEYEEELIKYKCNHDTTNYPNMFGSMYGPIKNLPVEALVAAIDNDRGPPSIWLSTAQTFNLELKSTSRKITDRVTDLINGRDFHGYTFEDLTLEYNGRRVVVGTYLGAGKYVTGCGIRVSSSLADQLELKLLDRVRLYK